MPVIGILAQYLDSRNDIRELIGKLAAVQQVVLYARKNELKTPTPGVTIREITARRRTVWNEVFSRLFYLFGKIPRSRQNYFIIEHFKIANTKTRTIFKFEKKLLLFLSRFTPRWMSYDQYLDRLDYAATTPIDDLEVFLCFTEIYDDYFFKHLIDARKKLFVYVYSWDHPCKMVRFSDRVHQYLVWNQGLKEDMVELQGKEAERVVVVGASQLAYIREFKEVEEEYSHPFPFEYVYFGCATGTPQLVRQEVLIIEQVAKAMTQSFPHIKLVVRPYPFLKSWNLYKGLRERNNVYFDDYRPEGSTFALSRERIYEKFVKIKFARAFMHIGTTMGFEATYFDTPVLQINFNTPNQGPLGIHGFIHQYQNDKYLMPEGYPNVLVNARDFQEKFALLLKAPETFLPYNRHVAGLTRLKNFDEFCQELPKELRNE